MPSLLTNPQDAKHAKLAYVSGCIPTSAGWETQLPITESDVFVDKAPLPSHCVDYLTHDWEDEDLARSWRAVSRQKSGVNCARLENASWRIWAKRRNNIPTLNPAELNWHKDNDTTWLYGPLLTHPKADTVSSGNSAPVTKSASFVVLPSAGLKPALKKRTSLQNLRHITSPPAELAIRPKLRFNTRVEQYVAVDSPIPHESFRAKRRGSILKVASTTIKYESTSFTESYDDDEYDSYYGGYMSYSSPGPSAASTFSSTPSLQSRNINNEEVTSPIFQKCYNAVSTTVQVFTWARNLIF